MTNQGQQTIISTTDLIPKDNAPAFIKELLGITGTVGDAELAYILAFRVNESGEVAWETDLDYKTPEKDGKRYFTRTGGLRYDPLDLEKWALRNRQEIERLYSMGVAMADFAEPDNGLALPLELEAANRAFVAIYRQGRRNCKQSDKKNIEQWLRNAYKNQFSEAAIDRIATIVNPNKSGGPPSQ